MAEFDHNESKIVPNANSRMLFIDQLRSSSSVARVSRVLEMDPNSLGISFSYKVVRNVPTEFATSLNSLGLQFNLTKP